MSNHLDFSVRLQMLTDSFNQNAREAGDKFAQMTRSIQQRVTEMNADTQKATDLLGRLSSNTDASTLTAELERVSLELRRMGSGANLTQEQIDAAMTQAATHTARLAQQLRVARDEAQRLGSTDASPDDIERATAEISRLETELQQASRASNELADEMARAMNRAADTADGARNAIYRMTNLRMPNDIRTEINQLRQAATDFQNNSGAPAEEIERVTRAATEQINRLERELNGLDEQVNETAEGMKKFSGGVAGVKNAIGSLQGILAAAGLGIGIAEIIETADAFKTLEARIKLATGEGAAFEQGFAAVKGIANETFSSIESTGELFARISQASESLGLAQSEVLSVTMTINQAIKLSGGSASAADAAITQLVQGLQSGVVRGDEFNSIMEQSPRLSQAMADGLGVTKGELRAMAMEGQLTSEVVIKAVQSQAATITEEFATLPTTVGDSLQVLKNKMFDFVGSMDKSVNQSSKLADAVNMVSEALDNMDPATVDAVNEVFNQLINTLGGLWTVISGFYSNLSASINALTNSSMEAQEQVGAITRAMQVVSVALGYINDGLSALSIAFDLVYGISTKWLSAIASGLAALSFGAVSERLSLVAKRLGDESEKAFGRAEAAAMGFDSAAEQALGNMAKTAQQRLNEAADEATAAYKKMSDSGEASAEALEGAFVRMAQAQVKAHGENALAALQAIGAEQGLKVAIDDTGKAIIDKMSDDELAAASIAANAKKIDAEFNKLANTVGVGLTGGYREAKAEVEGLFKNFDVLSDSGYEAGEVMIAALQGMLKNAKNPVEVKDLIAYWEMLGKEGKITGEELKEGLAPANAKLDEMTEGVNSVIEAYKLMGLITREEAAKQAEAYRQAYFMILKDGNATAAQLQEAFKKYASATISLNGGVVDSTLQNQAAQRGLRIEVDELGRASFKALDDTSKAADKATGSVNRTTNSFGDLGNSASAAGNNMKGAADRAYKAYDKLQTKLEDLKIAQDALAEKRQQALAPDQGNQFGTRQGVEGFLKSAGLSEAQAAEQARKLYAKSGQQDGALNFGKLQGFQDGQMMTTRDLQNFKSASQFLYDIARDAKKNEKKDSGGGSYDDSSGGKESKESKSAPPTSHTYDTSKYDAEFKRMNKNAYDKALEALEDGAEKGGDLSKLKLNLQLAADLYRDSGGKIADNAQAVYDQAAQQTMSANLPKVPDQAPPKTVKIEIKQANGRVIEANVPAGQENDWTEFARQLGESRSVAGY